MERCRNNALLGRCCDCCAVASPLLEDVNLAGAKGVLVNITAGMDMSIGEFEEVGDVIKDFTSDQATVVVGTVIDPEMTDELRVTIVVTGLESDDKTTLISGGASNSKNKNATSRQSVSFSQNTESLNRATLDNTAVNTASILKRQVPVEDAVAEGDLKYASSEQSNNMDIPTFLRRKTD